MILDRWSIHSTIDNHESNNSLVLPECLVECFGGLLGSAAGFGHFPLHLARADLILRDAAGLAGVGIDYRGRPRLQLPCAPRGYQDIPIVAVEAFNQLHWDSPLENQFELSGRLRPTALPSVLIMIPRKLRTCCRRGHTKGCKDGLHFLLEIGQAKTLSSLDDRALFLGQGPLLAAQALRQHDGLQPFDRLLE